MKHFLTLACVASLFMLSACPQSGEQQGGTQTAVDPLDNAAGGSGQQPDSVVVLESPLWSAEWDGEAHSMPLSEFSELLLNEGAAALLSRADFSGFETRAESESGPEGEEPIAIWLLPEDETPVGFSAQLVAFGDGKRMIFGFSAAWYAANFGIAPEELDTQFRSMHEEHCGAVRNYAYLDPDFDISFFQFDFGDDGSGTWGSPYMTHKRFTMHGDIPEWNFYCIGIDAGATLATRRGLIAEAQDQSMPDRSLPEGIGNEAGPDRLLSLCATGGSTILNELGIDPASGNRSEGFSLARVLRPRTQLMGYTGQLEDGYPQYELLLAENSLVQQLSFTDSWLGQQGLASDDFVTRFEELSAGFAGWQKEPDTAAGTEMRDSGVIIGNWEISRRQFSLDGGGTTSSWAIRPLQEDDGADVAAEGEAG